LLAKTALGEKRRPAPDIDRESWQSSGGPRARRAWRARRFHLTGAREINRAARVNRTRRRIRAMLAAAPSATLSCGPDRHRLARPFSRIASLAKTSTGAPAKRHRARIRTERSPFFQLLVLANLTARPFHERFGRRLHMSLSEWRVLLLVADRPGATAQDLADY